MKYHEKYNNYKEEGKMFKKKKWIKIVLVVLLVIFISFVAVVIWSTSSIKHDTSAYVKSWSDISSNADSQSLDLDGTSSVVSSAITISGSTTKSASSTTKSTGSTYVGKNRNTPIIIVPQKDTNIENILFMGIDGNNTYLANRSDSMIVASFNKKTNTLKLTSILRDVYANFPNLNKWGKINGSYSYGGPGMTVNIINYNFKLDIQKYVVVDFANFSKIINTCGGVEITVTQKEAAKVTGLTAKGTYNLNGDQALAYSRIRYIDSDFIRVQRQRNVINSLFQKFKQVDIVTKTNVLQTCLGDVRTNISNIELLGDLFNFMNSLKSPIQQYTVPAENMYTSVSHPTFYLYLDYNKQLPALNSFIYN
jgi:LCP family protein required for cell wall assembly